MRLFKKILPAISATSVLTIVTPLVASCAKDNSSGWLKANYDLDPEAEGFIKLDRTDLPPADESLATKEYAWAIYNNKQIIYDDYRYWLTVLDKIVFDLPYELYLILPVYSPVSMVYSDVTMMRGKMSDLSVNPSLYTMTFDIEAKVDVEIAIEIPALRVLDIDPVIVFSIKTNFNGHFDKCPFYIGPDYIKIFFNTLIPDIIDDKGAFWTPNLLRMLTDPLWYETLNFQFNLQTFNDDIDVGIDFNSSKGTTVNARNWFKLDIIDYLLILVGQFFGGWSSYYLSEMEW